MRLLNRPTLILAFVVLLGGPASVWAQTPVCGQPLPDGETMAAEPSVTEGTRATFYAPPPAGYTIGPGDVLTVNFWRDDTLSGDVYGNLSPVSWIWALHPMIFGRWSKPIQSDYSV